MLSIRSANAHIILATCFLLMVNLVRGAVEEDKFTQLPSCNESMATNAYSGYLTVTDSKALHYVFIESEDTPSTDPVVIWFNGGPGCSSMLAMFQEHGPWVIEDGAEEIVKNPYPWNQRANMLYIESPAGVGYSIANETSDWIQNDMSQSQDALIAVKEFYTKYPEYLSNELFVSGESYGGIYVPYLSWQIYQNNIEAEFNTSLTVYNLTGFLVGNGATNWDYDVSPSFPEMAYNFNLISKSQIDFFRENDCVYYFNDFRNHSGPDSCDEVNDAMMEVTGGLNWYDLYRDVYAGGIGTSKSGKKPLVKSSPDRMATAIVNGVEKKYKKGYTMSEYTPWVNHIVKGSDPDEEIVLGEFLTDYMNSEDLRTALHIPDYAPAFEQCSSQIDYRISDEASQWIYPVMKAGGIRMIFFSGDSDGAVPTYGSIRWIRDLDWDVTEAWRPWTTNGQVSGYFEGMDGLDFATVKGVGHMAPQWNREAVTHMFSAWIHGEVI